MFFYVYVLHSSSGRSYVGFTKNLKHRLDLHNSGQSSFTKRDSGWRIVYSEAYINETDARIREKFLKSGRGREILKKQLAKTFS